MSDAVVSVKRPGIFQNLDGSICEKTVAAFLFGGLLIVGGIIALIVALATNVALQTAYIVIGGTIGSGVLVLLLCLGMVTMTDVKSLTSQVTGKGA